MQTINISQKDHDSLKEIILPVEVFNSESEVYDFTYLNEKKVLKTLFTEDEFLYNNKLYTIKKLNEYQEVLPKSFCIPDYLALFDEKVFGFTTPFFYGQNLATILMETKISPKEKIFYLKKIGLLLEELKNIRTNTDLKDIYINDLHESNILINTHKKELGIIDLDSCKIGTNCSFVARYLSPFSIIAEVEGKYIKNDGITSGPGYIKADENTDIYCYIMIILNYLTNGYISRFSLKKFYDYLNFLSEHRINKELLDIIENITKKEDNINPYYLLDSLSEHQIQTIKDDTKKFIKIK